MSALPHITKPASRFRRRGVALVSLVTAIAAGPDISAAQGGAKRIPRRVLFTLIGSVIGGGAAALYNSSGESPGYGTCSSAQCVGTVSLVAGSMVGYLVGRERDHLHALRFRGSRPLAPPMTTASLTGEPSALSARSGIVVAAGGGGVQPFSTTRARDALAPLPRRAARVRGIFDVALTGDDRAVAIASLSGVYRYAADSAPGTLVREGSSTAVGVSGTTLYAAVGGRVERIPLTADSAAVWPGTSVGSAVADLAVIDDGRAIWVLVDSALVLLRPDGDSLVTAQRVSLGSVGRRLDVVGQRIAVALGEGGVILLNVNADGVASERARWKGARFAYDVSLVGSRLLVAAGVDGVYVLEVGASDVSVLGLARSLGFAVALASVDGVTYVIDRAVPRLIRIPSTF